MTPDSTPQSPRPVDALAVVSEIVRTERSNLARAARGEGLGPEDAIDAVQEALVTVLRVVQDGELPAGAALRPYLYGIVRNAARNRRRLHHVAKPHEPIDDEHAVVDEPAAPELVARAEEHVRLRACVARLCDTQRAVVTLRLLDEQGGQDVAASLGVTRGHVDVLLHRAKVQLRDCMLEGER